MKNLTRLSVGLLLAAVVGLSSCVKNEVSDEVKALRQAQVSLLNAQVTAILADANYVDAETAYQLLVNAYKEADDAYKLQATASNLAVTIANNEATAKQAETNLANAMLAQAQAAAAYQRFIDQGEFSANVMDLLGKYNNENRVLQQLYSDRITLTKQIAENNLLITSANYDVVRARYVVKIAEKQAKLDAANAALTAYETAIANPADIEAQKNALKITIDSLKGVTRSMDVDIQLAANAVTAKQTQIDNAELAIGLMEDWDAIEGAGFIQDELDLLEDSLGFVQDLADATADLAAANASLTLAKSTLTAAKSALTSATTAYTAKQALYATALTNNTNAVNTLATKEYLLEVATNNYNAGLAAIPALTAAQLLVLSNAVDAAQTARDDAYDVINDADGTLAKLNQAEIDRDAAESTMDDAQDDVDDAQSDVDDAQDDVDSAMDDIASANEDLADNAIRLAIIRGKIAEWTPKYNAAVLALPTLYTEIGLLSYKSQTLTLAKYDVESMIDELDAVVDDLVNYRDYLSDRIKNKQDEIKDLEDEIVEWQAAIDQKDIDETWLEGVIANLESLLAVTEVKITESEGIVAVWKKLLDDAIAAQG